ncbi:hypothetical protein E3P92_00264 [Wallemia ichthyophaga]|uniref:MICOS complex subunit n=2 Tax=Wallemia ichthyophaga TaxID=245174 RepID=A0A4T0EMT7_WALIC|nr:uncharacterized protein J056_000333 [Wallemia ichthyophaga EXF-994]TIA75374.1 hypothetical protein E3P91_00540 [Wallemia ichthyophaga]EOR04970.1 hypothetical protein J056_000333 [Wallemia ichthyophaga EXF-994]TIA84064.1 hypothetical protein E3P98_00406 [Wallemia ichthyophaga]TIA93498.1 hypothetical protein E3P97_00956 [Wallemia ichthyophaga]TIA97068.1 hypothetical protein E3P95_02996 [Wallemia ichthyophaga]
MTLKPSIYDNPNSQVIVTETSNDLVHVIGQGRELLQDKLGSCNEFIRSGVDGFIRFEDCVKTQSNQILDKNEQLSPNIFYIAVAGLGGSILARNSNILMRLSLPPTAALATSYQLLPQSTSNGFNKLTSIEESKFPQLHNQRLELKKFISNSFIDTKNTFSGWNDLVQQNTNKGFDKIQEMTGFRVGN